MVQMNQYDYSINKKRTISFPHYPAPGIIRNQFSQSMDAINRRSVITESSNKNLDFTSPPQVWLVENFCSMLHSYLLKYNDYIITIL